MGTDIHLIVEARVNDGARWRTTEVVYSCDPCDGKKCYECSGTGRLSGYHSRNYDVFSILADVCNGHGVAGDGFVSISKPRGLPSDLSASGMEDAEDSRLGDHSFSWLRLDELLSYDWDRFATIRGVVNAKEFEDWVRSGREKRPARYCVGVGGGRTEMVDIGAMELLIANGKAAPNHHTQVSWKERYSERADQFYSQFMPALTTVGAPSNVRIVFGFDS